MATSLSGGAVDRGAQGRVAWLKSGRDSVISMKTSRHVEEQLQLLFSRCPDLWGFAVRGESQSLFVSDVGISPRLSPEQYGEIFDAIATTLSEVLDEEPQASEWLRNRTFARRLH
jgi:hypothetical protein